MRFLPLMFALLLLVAACGEGDRSTPTATEPLASPASTSPASSPTSPAPAASPTAAVATLAVSLSEFSIDVEPETVPPGPASFDVTNDGDVAHEFLVIRSDLPPDGLPLTASGFEVDLDAVDVAVRYEAGDDVLIRRAETVALSAELSSGSYVLICNVPGHYESGMAAALTVE